MSQRLRSLDGLRGIGALVVLVYHAFLVIPALDVLRSTGPDQADPVVLSPAWLLYRTPLRLIWAGHEAVLLFFVLSGFVLTLPLIRGRRTKWMSYYARRLIRLYLPVWGSLVLAFALALIVSRDPSFGSEWLRAHRLVTPRALSYDFTLLFGTSNLNSPLWSLRWEIWFSILLPVMFWLLRRLRIEKVWLFAIVAFAVVSASAQTEYVQGVMPQSWLTIGLLEYMPVFGIGMMLALKFDRLTAWSERVSQLRYAALVFTALGVLALILLSGPDYAVCGDDRCGDAAVFTSEVLTLLAVPLVIWLALAARTFSMALSTKPMQWLGSRSFSIYLVHEPIIVAVALATHADSPWPWAGFAAVAAVASLLTAEVFFRLVERPSHLLSRRAGRYFARDMSADPKAVTADI